MCGICGFVGVEEEGLLERMTAALAHRGPDGEGHMRDGSAALGHTRLSIIDVAGGAQPIDNEDGALTLVCNGEIYNHRELRAELEAKGHRFRTHSDNEVLLHLYEEHGADCARFLNGMFAAAIWDRPRQRLFLVRDRFGIKPLYYAETPGGGFLFASELKALLRCRAVDVDVDPAAVREYLSLRYVPGPGTLLRGVRKFPTGHTGFVGRDGRLALTRYWKPPLGRAPLTGSEDEILEGFAEHFERSISRRLMAEVPLGAYLSGGVDSSTVVAAMARGVSTPISTYSVGFEVDTDELDDAAATAAQLGCNHHPIICRISDLELMPEIVYHLDEPVGDPIVLPMYRLAQEARKTLTVVLAGEGADEALGGYLFHRALLKANRMARLMPRWALRGIAAPALSLVPSSVLDRAFDYPAKLGRRGKQKVVDFARLFHASTLPEAYRHLISLYDERDLHDFLTDDFAAQLRPRERNEYERDAVSSDAPALDRIIHLGFAHWLPDVILTKQDKLAMANGLEARVPFLDHELVEYALRVPPELKIRGDVTKYLLRRYAERLLPPQVTGRKKMPFYAPLERFVAEPAFGAFVDEALSPETVRRRGYFRPEAVARLVAKVRGGEFMYVKQVFSLISLELWFRAYVDRRGEAA